LRDAAGAEEAGGGISGRVGDRHERGGGGRRDEAGGEIGGAVIGGDGADVEGRAADFQVEAVGDVKACAVGIGGPAARIAGVVRGRKAVSDAYVRGLRGDRALEEVAGDLVQMLRMGHAGGAVGLPQQRDGVGIIEPERLERAGDAVRGLRVVGVDERRVREGGRHGVEGRCKRGGRIAEQVELVVDPAPVVGGIRGEHMQVGAARRFVDGAQARGRTAQGGVPETAVEAVGLAADHADEFPAGPRVHHGGAGGVADRDDLLGETVWGVEGTAVTGLRVDEVGERIGEGGDGGLVVGVRERYFHARRGAAVADVVDREVIAVELIQRVLGVPQAEVRIVERVGRVERVGIRRGLVAHGDQAVSVRAPAQLLHEAGGIDERAEVDLLGQECVGCKFVRRCVFMAQRLADHVGEFIGRGHREAADHDFGGQVDIPAVEAV